MCVWLCGVLTRKRAFVPFNWFVNSAPKQEHQTKKKKQNDEENLISNKEKEEKKDKEESAKEEIEKMHELIIQSNLLSGGIENRSIRLFSAESQTQI